MGTLGRARIHEMIKAIIFLKSFSAQCKFKLQYETNGFGEVTAILSTTKERPWSNTGSIDDIHICKEEGESNNSFWDNVIDQIETSTGMEYER